MRRALSSTLVLLLLLSLTTPNVAASGQTEYGDAGPVISIQGSTIGWWTLNDNTTLSVNSSGGLSIWDLTDVTDGTLSSEYNLNRTIIDASLLMDASRDLIAISNSSGAVIHSIEYSSSLYVIPVGEAVDSVAWDIAGDLWLSLRASKIAAQYHDGTATGLQTTAHSTGITKVIVLESGAVITAGRDRQIRVHDGLAQFERTLNDPQSEITELWQDDSKNLHVLTKDGQYLIYETTNWTKIHDTSLSNTRLVSISDVGSDRLIIGTSGGNAIFINATDFSTIQTFDSAGVVVGASRVGDSGLLTLSAFISSSTVTLWDVDSDDDGVVNTNDDFPEDSTQTKDRDSDGYGDNPTGNNGDAFPDEPTQWSDSDSDGYGDNPSGVNADLFPDNEEQHSDSDGDGYGDAKYARDGDRFPDDPNQWADRDGDGFGDEAGQEWSDDCPDNGGYSHQDRLGCPDFDGDGWSDPSDDWPINPIDGADAFWKEPTQRRDSDGDGFGDNMSGHRGDQCPDTPVGYNVSSRAIIYNVDDNRAETVAMYGCTDSDGDKYADDSEAWWEPSNCPGILVGNSSEWLDYDRDCHGSNSDYDDTDSSVKTLEDWCDDNINDSSCREFRVGDDKPSNQAPIEEVSRSDSLISSLKDFAIIGLVVAVGMVAVLLLVQGMAGMVRSAKAKKDDEYKKDDATSEIETGKARSIGGIIDEVGWDDEVAPLEMTASLDALARGLEMDDETDDESEVDGESEGTAESEGAEAEGETSDGMTATGDDGSGEWQEGQEGWQHFEQDETDAPPAIEATASATPTESPVQQSTPAATEPAQQAATQQQPAEAPPIPASGLPEGWTEDQWRWYGHEWLQKNGGS